MKLYYSSGTCALACWIALAWAKDAGAIGDYAVEKLTMAEVHSPKYKAINPLAQVPAIDVDGRIFGQAGAILQYVADLAPTLGANNGAVNRLEFNELMNFLTGDFHPAFWAYFVPQRFTTDTTEQAVENVRQASLARIDRVLTHLDNLLGEHNHLYQNKRTVADAYAFVMVRWAGKLDKSWRDYPNVARFMNAMNEDDAVKAVLAES